MLCYVLGVAPDEFGLVPDGEGWVSVKELIKALGDQQGWQGVRASMVEDTARRLAPKDLQLAENKIRCLSRQPPRPHYGVEPPGHLYLGLRPRAWPVVRQRGLLAGESGPLVLCADEESALTLGRRKDPEPVLITVQARQAAGQGVIFALLGERLYLCDWVPPDCLLGPPVVEHIPEKKPAPRPDEERTKGRRPPAPGAMPGSFFITAEDVEKPYARKGLKKEIAWKKERRRGRRRGEE